MAVAPLATSLSTGLASSLSTSAIAGIALGAVAIVLARVAGVCIYRHYHGRPSLADAGDTQELEVIETVGQGAGEEPPNEQRRKIPSKPPRLKIAALSENPPMRPRDQFHEELGEQDIPWHEHRYENVGKYEDVGKYGNVGKYEDVGKYGNVGEYEDAGEYVYVDVGKYEDAGEYGSGDVGEYENVGEYGSGDVGEYENVGEYGSGYVGEYEDVGLYEEIDTCKTGGRS